jgi:hypothetical protein
MTNRIIIKLKKAGNRLSTFSISDDLGNVLATNVSKADLISGVAFIIDASVNVIILSSTGINCCSKTWNIPVSTITQIDLAAMKFQEANTSSLWRHLTNPVLYNNFYGCIAPYIIEYPFAYQYHDEIVQNVKDYTKVYKYLSTDDGVFNYNRKIETDSDYFNKSIIYNDQQSSGVLQLVDKPQNNLKAYLSYPKYNTDSKTILFSKRDNFYQYNTFWDVVKDKTIPLFINSCQSLSIDKELNQSNMIYTSQSFKKFTIRAKDLKVRQILDNRSDIHVVSQFLVAPAQISYL